MKLIVAIIRTDKLEAVQAALNERDVYLMTVSDVRGCGRQRGYTELYRGTEYQVRLLPKLKLEIAVNDVFVEATVEAIVHAARTAETASAGNSFTAYAADLLARAQKGELHDAHARILAEAEREILTQAITLAEGNQAKAARWLGLSRFTLREKLKQLGLHPVSTETSS